MIGLVSSFTRSRLDVNVLKRLVPRSPVLRHALVAIVAFSLGSAAAVQAAPGIASIHLADGTDPSLLARVDASGNQQVKVTNFPSAQAVTGTVTVGNTATNPVGVRDADNAARRAFQIYDNSHFFVGDDTIDFVLYTVPAGKRLVIEYIDGMVQIRGPSAATLEVLTYVNGIAAPHEVKLNTGEAWDTITKRTFSEAHRIYADGGTDIHITVTLAAAGDMSLNPISISGYLIDVP